MWNGFSVFGLFFCGRFGYSIICHMEEKSKKFQNYLLLKSDYIKYKEGNPGNSGEKRREIFKKNLNIYNKKFK